jgi:hypothetical protein
LIAPAPDDLLEAYEVSTAVNRTANDNPKLIERDLTLIGTEAVPERAAALGALSVPRRTTGRGSCFENWPGTFAPLMHLTRQNEDTANASDPGPKGQG